ncbi:hypothetical protein D477_009880 [Arthrobacter crystallopoietes BAB-32]|uniref:Peptidase C14 caspase domain-containing protein n=1 Tax=Arthrobacter crystallopoietes BAB-32 TaxID=1246476 RepID=N1V325_9MICC|nr:caspase family protein [Arthrobacter crystallopoietes]EMY34399.1 hypothetical protein D477_009880 [Arthrobacter crystallopoietes BAB-32]
MADYAVVVGISRYPKFAATGSTADLEGPDTDALDIRDWLLSPDGGALEPDNVRVIRSGDFAPSPEDPQPEEARIRKALGWLEEETAGAMGGRLYLYFSGHGFAPVLEEGALFTAEATLSIPTYVYAYDWLRSFRKALRFREYVLWMDCCMTHQQTIPVSSVVIRAGTGTGVPGPAFVAVAAQTKSALEHRMPDGKVHGVFSYTLLQGLRGGATDEHGRITAESLKAFLHDTMPEFLPEHARSASAVDLHPFIRADSGILFRKLRSRPTYAVRLDFPPEAAGQDLKLWTGRPHAAVVNQKHTGSFWQGELVRGLYVAEIADAGVRQGFQVTGAGAQRIRLTDTGARVRPPHPTQLFRLDVRAANPAATISVLDHNLQRVFTDTGELHEFDAPGVYKIRIELGRDISSVSEQVILLDADMVPATAPAPAVPSPAPIPGSALSSDAHAEPFLRAAAPQDLALGAGRPASALSVLARYWLEPDLPPPATGSPLEGLQLVSPEGTVLVDLAAEGRTDRPEGADALAVWERALEPGAYFLRHAFRSGRTGEATVMACEGWLTQIALQRSPALLVPGVPPDDIVPIVDAAVFMRRSDGSMPPAGEDKVLETVRLALAQGRDLLGKPHGAELQKLLLEEYDDPMAGIIGSYLLLIAMDGASGGTQAQHAQFDAAVVRLSGLVGDWHPDVAALSLRCSDPALRRTEPLTVPPIFRYGWQLIVQASYENPLLVPAALWQRVHAVTNFGPFLTWAADERAKRLHARQLRRWLEDEGRAADLQGNLAAGSLLIPASAADLLRNGHV